MDKMKMMIMAKDKEINKLNVIIRFMGLVTSLKESERGLKEDMECLHFDHRMEQRDTRRKLNNVVCTKQSVIKKMHKVIIEKRKMTNEMLDEVIDAKKAARFMEKTNNAINTSTSRLKKINSTTALKCNIQYELANLATQHCKEMLDREHLIADLQNTCDEKESKIVDLEEEVMDLMNVINLHDFCDEMLCLNMILTILFPNYNNRMTLHWRYVCIPKMKQDMD